jgi:four helix bundle protein
MESGYKSLKVYQKAFELAMKIFVISKAFPPEERYSLTDQIRRSSRSVCTNLADGYRKRIYPKHFISKVTDADGEASETMVWLDFALACNYIEKGLHNELYDDYINVGKMLGSMANNPEKFLPRKTTTQLS